MQPRKKGPPALPKNRLEGLPAEGQRAGRWRSEEDGAPVTSPPPLPPRPVQPASVHVTAQRDQPGPFWWISPHSLLTRTSPWAISMITHASLLILLALLSLQVGGQGKGPEYLVLGDARRSEDTDAVEFTTSDAFFRVKDDPLQRSDTMRSLVESNADLPLQIDEPIIPEFGSIWSRRPLVFTSNSPGQCLTGRRPRV